MRIRQDEKGTFLEVMTDKKGRAMTDIRCPVSCGCCCDFWKDVPSIALAKLITEVMGPAYAECPHLTETGCRLPRKKRPIECTMYLCELGILACEKLVTDEEIQHTLECSRQNDAFAFLSKQPPRADGKLKDLKVKPRDQRKFKKVLKRAEGVRNA